VFRLRQPAEAISTAFLKSRVEYRPKARFLLSTVEQLRRSAGCSRMILAHVIELRKGLLQFVLKKGETLDNSVSFKIRTEAYVTHHRPRDDAPKK
jgi:hypothetical protein